MSIIYPTITDYRDQVVIPALGEYADDYDTDAIAEHMTEWHDEVDTNRATIASQSGLIERNDLDFWNVVAANDRTV